MGQHDETIAVGRAPPPTRSLYGDELAPGAIVGEYRVVSALASGGGGRVYLAEHRLLRRRAAVKVLHRELAGSAEMVERFVREAKAVNRIAHTNIVDIYELGQLEDGRPFYVMEYVDGVDLDTLIRQRGRFGVHETLEIVEPVCAAVHAAHSAGVIHRDLKSSNVMIAEREGGRLVKLHDFGIAKLVESETGEAALTAIGRRLGTPYAMAPEQIRADPVDARTDVYALGVLLFQMLTGRYPFDAEDAAALESMHLEAPPPRPSQIAPISPEVEGVVLRCLEKRPERRWASAPELAAALRAAVRAGEGRGARSATLLQAVGIYVECRLDLEGGELDEDLLVRLADALDLAAELLEQAGYHVPVHIGGSLLGVRLAGADPPAGTMMRGAVDLAERVRGELAAHLAAGGEATFPSALVIAVHADRVVVRDERAVEGPLLHVAGWLPRPGADGVFVTPAARLLLDDQGR